MLVAAAATPVPIRASALPAQPEIEAARILHDALDSIEEIPDHGLRQQAALETFVEARAHATSRGAQDLLRMAAASVNYKVTQYGALDVARIAERAIAGGQFGTTPQLAAATVEMLDTMRYTEKDDAAWRILKEMKRAVPEASARVALELAERVEHSRWVADPSHGPFDATRHAVQALASGFTGTPAETWTLGVRLCQDVFRSDVGGGQFIPVMDTLAESAARPADKSRYAFMGDMAKLMPREAAERYLASLIPVPSQMPAGEAGAIQLAVKALESLDDGVHLAGQTGNFLAYLDKEVRHADLHAITTVASALDSTLHARDADRTSRQPALCDTSALVRLAVQRIAAGRGFSGDEDLLAFAREALEHIQAPENAYYGDTIATLARSVSSPLARQALDFAALITTVKGHGQRVTRDTVIRAIDDAREALAGHPRDPMTAGRALIATTPAPLSACCQRALLEYLRRDPAHACRAGILDMGLAAFDYSGLGDQAGPIGEAVLDRVAAGRTDAQDPSLPLLKELMACLPDAEQRQRFISSAGRQLLQHAATPDATRYLGLALELVRSGGSDAPQSLDVFERILDKVQELGQGKPLELVDDCLDVINAVPDRLQKANLLRGLVRKHAEELVRAGKVASALEGPIEDVSTMAATSSMRLQLQVDLLNLLNAAARSGQDTWATSRQLLALFPEDRRDVVACALFGYTSSSSSDLDLSRVRGSHLAPEDWKTLQAVAAGARTEPNTFALLKRGVEALEDHARRKPGERDFLAGALSFLLADVVAQRSVGNARIDAILHSMAGRLGNRRDRLDSDAAQYAVLDLMRAMIQESVQGKPMAQVIALDLDRCWKLDEIDANRKAILFTLEALARNNGSGGTPIEQWVMDNGGGASRPPAQVKDEGDYVVVGGIVLPKRRTA